MITGQKLAERNPDGVRQRGDLGKPGAGEQVGGALGAHVQVIAHGDALRSDGQHVQRAGPLQDAGDGRPSDLGEEAEPVDRLAGVPAEPCHVARPLVDAGVGLGAPLGVPYHQDRLRGAEGAGHRHHGVVVVGRVQADLAAFQQPVRLGHVSGPALRHHGGAHRAAQRIAVPRVRQRRPAVQQHPALDARDRLAQGRDPDELRRALVEPAHHLRVGLVDPRGGVAIEPAERTHGAWVALGRDAPLDLLRRAPLLPNRVGEHREPDVDDLDLIRQRQLWR